MGLTYYATHIMEKPILPTLIEFQVNQIMETTHEVPLGQQLEKVTLEKSEVNVPQKTSPPAKLKAAVPSKSQTKAIEPIVAPPLETVDLEEAPVVLAAPVFQEEMIQDDLERIDNETQEQLSKEVLAIKETVNTELEKSEQLHEKVLADVEFENQTMKEQAHASAMERQKQIEQAAQKAKAAAYGSPDGVRPLSELRQITGNKKPSYDEEDRYHKREGDVVFHAYVNSEGVPVNFKLIQSSGHRSLDAKTLAALKKWKFMKGQEGWVELPFNWTLVGGPQEKPSLLRR